MARRLDDYLAALPALEQRQVEARAAALAAEVAAHEDLRRRLQAAAPAATAQLKTTPTGVQKMERRVDAYLIALRDALTAAGGTLEIVARLPALPPVSLTQVEGLLGSDGEEAEAGTEGPPS